MSILRQYALVTATKECQQMLIDNGYADHPLALNHDFIYLGEIPNQKGHAVIIDCVTQKVLVGVHIDDLAELPE